MIYGDGMVTVKLRYCQCAQNSIELNYRDPLNIYLHDQNIYRLWDIRRDINATRCTPRTQKSATFRLRNVKVTIQCIKCSERPQIFPIIPYITWHRPCKFQTNKQTHIKQQGWKHNMTVGGSDNNPDCICWPTTFTLCSDCNFWKRLCLLSIDSKSRACDLKRFTKDCLMTGNIFKGTHATPFIQKIGVSNKLCC